MTIEQDRGRGVVLRHARDAAEAAELLAMLGLDDDQVDQQSAAREHVGRRSGEVHALSTATEARLAAPPVEPPAVTMPAVAPIPTPRPEPEPARGGSRPGEVRSCAGCGKPVVPQTRYRLDPAGYRARGVHLLAAKDRCHPCYNRQRDATASTDAFEPTNLPHCGDCGRGMVPQQVWPKRPDLHEGRARAGGYGMCNGCYGRARAAGTLPNPAPRRRRVELPDVSVSYEVACAVCGHLGTPTRRAEADRLRTQHLDAHRAQAAEGRS